MIFSENLKQIRKEKNITQEELAYLLDVSRQAVTKWESGLGYPEVEKLLDISKKLNVSLDVLMGNEIDKNISNENPKVTGKILIASYDELSIATCSKVKSSRLYLLKESEKNANYGLFGSENTGFWGGQTTLLGLYLRKQDVEKEMHEIMKAMMNGKEFYKLKYASKVKERSGNFEIIGEAEEHL